MLYLLKETSVKLSSHVKESIWIESWYNFFISRVLLKCVVNSKPLLRIEDKHKYKHDHIHDYNNDHKHDHDHNSFEQIFHYIMLHYIFNVTLYLRIGRIIEQSFTKINPFPT